MAKLKMLKAPKKPKMSASAATKENWLKSKYVPKENVIIIMDNKNGTVSLMIGDGETWVGDLRDILKTPLLKEEAIVDEDTLML